MGGLPGDDGRQEGAEESIPLKWEMCEAQDDFTAAICLDPRHVGAYEFHAKLHSRYDRIQKGLQDSEPVLKSDLNTTNASQRRYSAPRAGL